MPYIAKKDRDKFADVLREAEKLIASEGDLNYVITSLVDGWLGTKPRYKDYNAAIGVLSCAEMELYRRRVAKYEDNKRYDNGDVYNA